MKLNPFVKRFSRPRIGISLLIVIAFLILFLSSAAAFSQPATITFLMISAEADKLQILVDAFEEKHPDIHLNVVLGPPSILKKRGASLSFSPVKMLSVNLSWRMAMSPRDDRSSLIHKYCRNTPLSGTP